MVFVTRLTRVLALFSKDSSVKEWARDNGIALEENAPYIKNHNGMAECNHGMVQDAARTQSLTAGVSAFMWPYIPLLRMFRGFSQCIFVDCQFSCFRLTVTEKDTLTMVLVTEYSINQGIRFTRVFGSPGYSVHQVIRFTRVLG
jgi:hypothetical protein